MKKRSDDPLDRVPEKVRPAIPIWFAFIAPPIASITHLQAMYVLEHTACSTESKIQLHVASLVLFGVVVAAWFVAHAKWVELGSDDPGQLPGPLGSRRLMALLGMIGSGIFGLFILAQWLPAFILPVCIRT